MSLHKIIDTPRKAERMSIRLGCVLFTIFHLIFILGTKKILVFPLNNYIELKFIFTLINSISSFFS